MMPAWGYKHHAPPDDQVFAVFGARLIDSTGGRLQILHDRKSLQFREGLLPESQKLMTPQKPLERSLKLLERVIDPRHQSDEVYAIRDMFNGTWHATTYASQQSSYGYVYLTIWVTDTQQVPPCGTTELVLISKERRKCVNYSDFHLGPPRYTV